MKWILMVIFSLPALYSSEEKDDKYAFPAIETEWPLQWKAKIGNTSFKTNVLTKGNHLYVGSNGKYFMDANVIDHKAGVYKLNRKDGKIIRQIEGSIPGDMDVNGVTIYDGKLYFGNDNEEVHCTDLHGKAIWRKPVSGDIEHEPALIKIKGQSAIVVATEVGEVQALNPKNGDIIWSYFVPGFNGWKSGDNRAVMKVQAFFNSTLSFYTKPEVYDINGNGVNDLIYKTIDNKLIALEGKNGKHLFTFESDRMIDIHIVTFKTTDEGTVIKSLLFENDEGKRKSFLIDIDHKGKLVNKRKFHDDIFYFNDSKLVTKTGDVVFSTSEELVVIAKNDSISRISTYKPLTEAQTKEFNNWYRTRGAFYNRLGKETFTYEKSKNCVAVLHQYDCLVSEKGFMEIIDLDQKKVLKRLQMPYTGEMPLYIGDFTGDGKTDMIFGGHNETLYCYRIPD